MQLVQAVCSVLRTPIASVEHLTVQLPDPDAPKVQWTLKCYNGKVFLSHLYYFQTAIVILKLETETCVGWKVQ